MYKLLFLIFFIFSENAFSKDDLLNVVITPSRFEQSVSKTNSFVINITEEDIKKSSALNLVDLLNAYTSISIASTGGPGSNPSYFLRGFAKKYLKVTVDGLNIADPTGPQSETYLQDISLGDIKKIEILKSPQGSIHGGQAGGGVIAITTKEPNYNSKQFYQKFEVGSHNDVYSGTYVSIGKNNYKLSANLNVYHSDGISSMDEDDGNNEKDAYNFGNSTIKAKIKSNQNNVTFVFRDSNSKYEYDDSYNKKDRHDFTKTNIQSGLVKFQFKTGKKVTHSLIYNPSRVNRRAGGTYPSDQSSKQHKFEYLVQKKINNDNFFSLGGEYNNTKYKTGETKEKRESNAFFVQGQFQLTEKTNIDVSFRRDEDQLYDDHNSYRVQLGYDLYKDLKLKMSKGSGYRPPSLYEGNNLANGVEKLSPEETSNSEIGFDYKNVDNAFFLSGSYFRSKIKNKIDYVYSSGGYLQGSGKSEIDGYEITSKKYITNDILGIMSYTFTDSDETDKKGALVAMHKLSSTLNYNFSEDLSGNVNLIYQEKAYDTSGDELPSFTLLGSGFNYDINDNLNSYIKFNNMLDQDYQVNRNYGTPDFSVFAGIESRY